MTNLRKLLEKAKGRSENVIVVFVDVRGFSQFSSSKGRQATDVAMLIKRLYIKLMDEYFPFAHFTKPTGDGLMFVFEYTDENVVQTAEQVMRAVFKSLDDYPMKFFQDDLMITF